MDCKCDHGCKHDRLKFCEKCQKVHCLDCGKEWPQYDFSQPYIPYVPYIPYYKPINIPSVWYGDNTYGNSITTNGITHWVV